MYPMFEGFLSKEGEKFYRILVILFVQRNRMQRALTFPFVAAVPSTSVTIIASLYSNERNYMILA